MIDEAHTLTSGQPVTTVADMARLLRAGCPQQARDFALATHERACWAYDESRTLFWEQVVNMLSHEAELVEQVAA